MLCDWLAAVGRISGGCKEPVAPEKAGSRSRPRYKKRKVEAMKRIFVCSPFREYEVIGTDLAKHLCKIIANAGHAPFAPHLLYPQFLNDNDLKQRDSGIQCGLAFLDVCDELWLYTRNGISKGMRHEIQYAQSRGKKIAIIDDCSGTSDIFYVSTNTVVQEKAS